MFNGGSTLSITKADGNRAQLAIVNTVISPAIGGLTTFFFKKYIVRGDLLKIRYDFMGLCNGVLAGLVAITASCDSVEPWAAIIIGVLSSFVYSFSVKILESLEIDDPIEASQVHGCCGLFGCLCVAIFKRDEGIVYWADGCWKLLGIQCLGIVCIMAWAIICTTIFYLVARRLGMVRIGQKAEILGGDIYYFGPMEFDASVNVNGIEIEMAQKKNRADENEIMEEEEVDEEGEEEEA
uniref:Ammonium transporter AmtB-like domain-containing protein n=1 Tax=Strombidium rassoulzadegani TaxID=1082188 RepID=A0A7S3CR55_9SPIT|mmetsp:Transcript_4543/g.7730  ORF Transcript_4543/g.7730 Transcript_4543/m.7730 type:complete len:238 (+) Transcript_4543:936-1649(+)